MFDVIVRLAEQIPFYDSFINSTNANALLVAEFLQQNQRVKNVHWAYQEKFRKNYEKFAGSDRSGV